MDEKKVQKNILKAGAFLMGCFALLFVYIMYIQLWQADELAAHPMNRRSNANIDVIRGSILDAYGNELARSQKPGQREYPYGAVMMPVTGYLGEAIGSAGLENLLGDELSGQSRQLKNLGPVSQLLQSERGNSIKLTVDAEVQQLAYDALGDNRGAVVVMDAHTGAIIAMVSKPSANPQMVETQWQELSQRKDSPLLNRAAQGLYPPGSTMKVLIADAALNEKITDLNEVFDCNGKLEIGREFIQESHGAVHGKVKLSQAVTESCNTTFGTLALRMGSSGLKDAFQRFGFYDDLSGEITESQCHLPEFKNLSDGDIAQVGIGQSELLVTPLRMAMLAAAFANDGKMMLPYIVDQVISPQGVVLRYGKGVEWRTVTTAQRAKLINSFMENVVEEGTGAAARVPGVRVTGKTGTAENAAGADHGWFIGTAELGKRTIAFCVIVENSGGGGTVAAPIARQIIVNLKDK